MSAVTKAIDAATRLVRAGDTAEATRVIREALTLGLAPQTIPGGASDAGSGPSDPFCCLGPAPGQPDLAARLAEWTAAARTGPSVCRTEPTKREEASAPGLKGTFARRSYTGTGGALAYKLYDPGQALPPVAMIVMLHGCKQYADDFARGTRMNDLADAHNLLVVYPEQTHAANMSGCWNWFDPQHQGRGAGEPGLLAGLTRAVAEEFHIGSGRIFVAGLSAGGAMAAVLAEIYPDLFAGVGIHSGLAFGAASDVSSAFAAMKGTGGGALGMGWTWPGQAVPAAPQSSGPGIPTIVFHGDADQTVHPGNADAILARIVAREAGLSSTTLSGVSPGGEAFVRTIGCDADGIVRYENWTIKGAGHAWSGGSPDGSYTDPRGPDASAEMVRFFVGTIG